MSVMGTHLNKVAEIVAQITIPTTFPDLMDITLESTTSDGAGGLYHASETDVATNVPCAYLARTSSFKDDISGKLTSVTEYLVRYPCQTAAGAKIPENTQHQFEVATRGDEPAKTFRVKSIANHQGVWYEATCTLEDGAL